MSGEEEYRLAHLCVKHNFRRAAVNELFSNHTMATVNNIALSHCIQKVEWNVLHNSHQLLEIVQSMLQSFGWSKQPSWYWLHTSLPPQFCWIHWVPHVAAWVQWIYVVCSSKGIKWSWGIYLLRGEIKGLVLEWTGTLVEFLHSYADFDHINSYGSHLELRLDCYSAVQSWHVSHTIRSTRRIGQYISVLETWTWQFDQSLRILQASLLPFFLFLWNITLNDMEKQLTWRNNKSIIRRF